MYSSPNASVLQVNDANENDVIGIQNSLIYAPFLLTDIHGREDLVVNMRQDMSMVIRKEHETLAKIVSIIHSNGWYRRVVGTSRPQLGAEVRLQRTFWPNELYISSVPKAWSAFVSRR